MKFLCAWYSIVTLLMLGSPQGITAVSLQEPDNEFGDTHAGPVYLEFSTFLGGGNDPFDRTGGFAISKRFNGQLYVAGVTTVSDFPVVNGFDSTYADGGGYDIFLAILSADGKNLIWSSYLGGSDIDYVTDMFVSDQGSIFLVGYTTSRDFPTVAAFDDNHGGQRDAFVTQIKPDGSGIEFSTFLGGTGNDEGRAIVVDDNGRIIVVGQTASEYLFPIVNALDLSFDGPTDAFISVFSSDGSTLETSTFWGGRDFDGATAVGLDSLNNIFIAGTTTSDDFPTANAFDSSLSVGDLVLDIFVSKFSPNVDSVIYSTYLGGGDYDAVPELNGLAVDAGGSVYLTGRTLSNDFPIANAFDSSYASSDETPGGDAFVLRLSPSGDSLIFSSYLGGGSTDWGFALALDKFGYAYVGGYTTSSDFPTQSAIYYSIVGGEDCFLTKISPNGSEIMFSTLFGGSDDDRLLGLTVDSIGNIYSTGWTRSADFPTTQSYEPTFQGGEYEAFIAKMFSELDDCCTVRGDIHALPTCESDGVVSLTDLSLLVNHMFVTFGGLCCLEAADMAPSTPDGTVNLTDLTALVNHLFVTFEPLPTCD